MKKLIFLLALLIITPQVSDYQGNFSIIVLQDLQGYNHYYPKQEKQLMNWIVDNKDNLNIKYVLMVGDMVESGCIGGKSDEGNVNCWKNGKFAFDILKKNNISYLIAKGDHDSEEYINNYFPNRTMFIEDENLGLCIGVLDVQTFWAEDNGVNHYPYRVIDSQISILNKEFSEYPNSFCILIVHHYDNYYGNVSMHNNGADNIILNNSNIFMVLSGHFHGNNIFIWNRSDESPYYSIFTGHNTPDCSNPRTCDLKCFSPVNESDGMIRILTFYDNGTINSRQYSPLTGKTYINTDLNNYNINYTIKFPNQEYPACDYEIYGNVDSTNKFLRWFLNLFKYNSWGRPSNF